MMLRRRRRRRRVMTSRIVTETVVRSAGRCVHRRRESLASHHRSVAVMPSAARRLRVSPLREAKCGESQNAKNDFLHCFTPYSFFPLLTACAACLSAARGRFGTLSLSLPPVLFNTKREEKFLKKTKKDSKNFR